MSGASLGKASFCLGWGDAGCQGKGSKGGGKNTSGALETTIHCLSPSFEDYSTVRALSENILCQHRAGQPPESPNLSSRVIACRDGRKIPLQNKWGENGLFW